MIPCPSCGFEVEEVKGCSGCRQKIQFYICPGCGGRVVNPVYRERYPCPSCGAVCKVSRCIPCKAKEEFLVCKKCLTKFPNPLFTPDIK